MNQAIQFLTAGEGDLVEDPNKDPNEESIPRDYPAQHPLVSQSVKFPVDPLQNQKPKPAVEEKVDDEERTWNEKVATIKRILTTPENELKDHHDLQRNSFPEYLATLLLLLVSFNPTEVVITLSH